MYDITNLVNVHFCCDRFDQLRYEYKFDPRTETVYKVMPSGALQKSFPIKWNNQHRWFLALNSHKRLAVPLFALRQAIIIHNAKEATK